jgi:sigma-B regulation protein RsbU (phosphoserine phosphatase)
MADRNERRSLNLRGSSRLDFGETQRFGARHPPMLLLRRGSVLEIAENGWGLAAFEFAKCRNAAYTLEPGDRFLLYTDGVLEAENTKGDFFGQESLSALLGQTAELPENSASDQLIASVQQGSAAQNDDLTIVVCDSMPRSERWGEIAP